MRAYNTILSMQIVSILLYIPIIIYHSLYLIDLLLPIEYLLSKTYTLVAAQYIILTIYTRHVIINHVI